MMNYFSRYEQLESHCSFHTKVVFTHCVAQTCTFAQLCSLCHGELQKVLAGFWSHREPQKVATSHTGFADFGLNSHCKAGGLSGTGCKVTLLSIPGFQFLHCIPKAWYLHFKAILYVESLFKTFFFFNGFGVFEPLDVTLPKFCSQTLKLLVKKSEIRLLLPYAKC